MKKILISIVTIFAISFFALAEMTIYVYKKDGTKVPYVAAEVDSIGFSDKTEPIAVDLGLSVKWANFNVGANAPEDYGDYFAWGEIESKDYYDWNSYKWCEGKQWAMTKYCISSSCGTVDNKITLEPSDDAANVTWGEHWRIPTEEEQEELSTECIWDWTKLNGVYGYLVTSKINGNSIFLPAAGYRNLSEFNRINSGGYYWNTLLYTKDSNAANRMHFNSDEVYIGYDYRRYGYSIRPVLAK